MMFRKMQFRQLLFPLARVHCFPTHAGAGKGAGSVIKGKEIYGDIWRYMEIDDITVPTPGPSPSGAGNLQGALKKEAPP